MGCSASLMEGVGLMFERQQGQGGVLVIDQNGREHWDATLMMTVLGS